MLRTILAQKMEHFDSQKIKVVAIDIDGTLINEKSICTQRTEDAVKALIKTGREVYIVTGRAQTTAMPFAKQVTIPKYMINYNGAAIWDFQNQTKMFENYLNNDYSKEIFRIVRENQLMAIAYCEDEFYYELENDYLRQYLSRVTVTGFKKHFNELPSDVIQKFFIMGANNIILRVHDELKILFNGELTMFLTTPGMHNLANPDNPAICLEVMAPQVNKGNALKKLLEFQNISMDEVVAFGDDNNDIEMIEMVGWGVAMNNARPLVKEKARLETLSNEEDGVAYFIETYLL